MILAPKSARVANAACLKKVDGETTYLFKGPVSLAGFAREVFSPGLAVCCHRLWVVLIYQISLVDVFRSIILAQRSLHHGCLLC